MSNCIEFRKNSQRVHFTSKQLDIPAFLEEAAKHRDHEYPFDLGDQGQCGFCWFVRSNYELQYALGKPWAIVFYFGEGQSSHTWRDFRWLLHHLNQYILQPKDHTFWLADESDGYREVGYMAVTWPWEEPPPPPKPKTKDCSVCKGSGIQHLTIHHGYDGKPPGEEHKDIPCVWCEPDA